MPGRAPHTRLLESGAASTADGLPSLGKTSLGHPEGSDRECLSEASAFALRCVLLASTALGWACAAGSLTRCASRMQDWVRLWADSAPVLGLASACAGLLYLHVAAQEPRPRYMHMAGAFFACNSAACSLVAVTISAGCASIGWLEHVALAGILLCETAGYGLLQLMILLKVEALCDSHEGQAIRWRLSLVGILWISWAALFILRILGVLAPGYHQDATVLETAVGASAALAFVDFTIKCVRAMWDCSSVLAAPTLENGGQLSLWQTLRAHAGATAVANGASVLQMVMIVMSQVPYVEASYSFVVVHILDIACNVLCATCLSGIATGMAVLPALNIQEHAGLGGKADVLGEFAVAGRMARTAAAYGTLGEPLSSR